MRRGLFILLLVAPLIAGPITSELKQETVQAFDKYIREAEARIDREQSQRFLWADGSPDRLNRLRKGEVVSEPWKGKAVIEVPDGLVHDWIGAVFVPGITIGKAIATVQNYGSQKDFHKPEVVDSKLLARDGSRFRIFLRLLKKKVLTVVLNTEHEVSYFPINATRWHSRSYSTKIAEVEDPGKPAEREIAPGRDHGFLWRLNSYWRFEERDGGVYVECEAISLTRDVPAGFGWIINPIIRDLPKESLANTLANTRRAMKSP